MSDQLFKLLFKFWMNLLKTTFAAFARNRLLPSQVGNSNMLPQQVSPAGFLKPLGDRLTCFLLGHTNQQLIVTLAPVSLSSFAAPIWGRAQFPLFLSRLGQSSRASPAQFRDGSVPVLGTGLLF